MRDWSIGRLGCNVTERAIEKHDLMRGWSTGRLGCNVTERAIQRATGSSCFSNIQFKQRCWNFMHILLLWSCWDVTHAQKHFLVCTFTLDQVSVYAVGGTSVHPSCTPLAITWTLLGPIPTVEDFNFWVNVLQLVTIILLIYLTLNYLSLDSPSFASTVIAMVEASLSLLSLVSPLLSSLIPLLLLNFSCSPLNCSISLIL